MFGLSITELLVILVVLVLVFGPSRLPELGQSLGKAIGGFKKSMSERDQIDVTPREAKSEPPPGEAEDKPKA